MAELLIIGMVLGSGLFLTGVVMLALDIYDRFERGEFGNRVDRREVGQVS